MTLLLLQSGLSRPLLSGCKFGRLLLLLLNRILPGGDCFWGNDG